MASILTQGGDGSPPSDQDRVQGGLMVEADAENQVAQLIKVRENPA